MNHPSSAHGMSGQSKVPAGDMAAVVLTTLALLVPLVTANPLAYSLTNQILIASTAALSVYIMLRMDLLSFALPAFMALGGYAAAICAKAGLTSLPALMGVAFTVPAVVALLMGALVLRLRGTYFVLVTFAFNEVLQLFLFEAPTLTGGSNGITNVPAVTFLQMDLSSNRAVLTVTCVVAVVAALVAALVTSVHRREFASISENETLAQSLGLTTWRYKATGFVVSAGIAGLAGFALVNMLMTAHPSSFTTINGFNYIVYAIVGGRGTMLGPLLGAATLMSASHFFSSKGEYSPALYGVLVILAVMLARNGIAGIRLPGLGGRTTSSSERLASGKEVGPA